MDAKGVLSFWFDDHGFDEWFMGGEKFDREVKEALSGVHAQAVRSELWTWRETKEGRLAEIILLDQVSRQLHRGEAAAFASDTMALALAQELVYSPAFETLNENQQLFALMPFQHAESLVIQEESVRLYEIYGGADIQDYARGHRETIARFGRFPMRNKALGRKSTPEETAYMAERDGKVF